MAKSPAAGIGGEFESMEMEVTEEPSVDSGAMAKEGALRDFFTKGKKGDFAGAAAAFQTAYDLCAAKAPEVTDEEFSEDIAVE